MIEPDKKDKRFKFRGVLIRTQEVYRKTSSVWYLSAAVVVLLIDYITGRAVQFPIYYLLPAGMAAWRHQKAAAYALATLLPLARITFHFLWQDSPSLSVSFVNAAVEISALVFYVYLVDRTSSQTRELEKKVKILEGILPICASCKRIRNEKGEYEQIEKYVSEHSEASFSHGLCSECAEKLYPEYFKGKHR